MKIQIHLMNRNTSERIIAVETDTEDWKNQMNPDGFSFRWFLVDAMNMTRDQCADNTNAWHGTLVYEHEPDFWPRDSAGRHIPPSPK